MKLWLFNFTLKILLPFREISLIGNRLECEGFNEFLRPLVSLTESHRDAVARAPLLQHQTIASKTELARSQPQAPPHSETPPPSDLVPSHSEPQAPPTEPPAPPPMPPLTKLLIQDNCIDVHGECTDMDGVFASVLCMRALKRYNWIMPYYHRYVVCDDVLCSSLCIIICNKWQGWNIYGNRL